MFGPALDSLGLSSEGEDGLPLVVQSEEDGRLLETHRLERQGPRLDARGGRGVKRLALEGR